MNGTSLLAPARGGATFRPEPDSAAPNNPMRAGTVRQNRKRRTPGAGLFARRNAQRLSREEVAARARLLPKLPQALVTAHFSLGMSVEELALLHRRPRVRIYRLLMHWRDVLSDRSFLLAAHYAGELAKELAELARAHWMEGLSLRQLAVIRHETVHEVRTRLAEARVALVMAAARRHAGAGGPDAADGN